MMATLCVGRKKNYIYGKRLSLFYSKKSKKKKKLSCFVICNGFLWSLKSLSWCNLIFFGRIWNLMFLFFSQHVSSFFFFFFMFVLLNISVTFLNILYCVQCGLWERLTFKVLCEFTRDVNVNPLQFFFIFNFLNLLSL